MSLDGLKEILLKYWDKSPNEISHFTRNFLLTLLARNSLAILPHLKFPMQADNLKRILLCLVSEEEGVRLGLFVAIYFTLFRRLERLLPQWRSDKKSRSSEVDGWNAFLAAAISSTLSLPLLPPSTRYPLSQYLLFRALASTSSHLISKHPSIQRSLDPWMNALLFAVCSGQAVYSFVVRPQTVDPSYRKFLTQVTHLPRQVIELFQGRIREGLIKCDEVGQLAQSVGLPIERVNLLLEHQKLDCRLLHPNQSCCQRVPWIFGANLRLVFPTYLLLHLIPSLPHHHLPFNKLLPKAILNGLQSSCFISAYVAIFQSLLCIQRNAMRIGILRKEWKYSFWIMGFISAISIFIEKKSRRSELLLYMLPRSVVSLYRALVEKGMAVNVPMADIFMFATAMAILKRYYRKDYSHLSPIINRMFNLFLLP